MKIGTVVRPPQESLGAALTLANKPVLPTRPIMHRNGAPPTVAYHTNHPTLASPAVAAPLPTRATQGVNETQLNSYLKALQSGR